VRGNVSAWKGSENARGRGSVIASERGNVSVKGRERTARGRTAIGEEQVPQAKRANAIRTNSSIPGRRPDLRFRSDSLSFQILRHRHDHSLYLPKRSANKLLLPFLPSNSTIIVRVTMASNLRNSRQGIRSYSNKPRLANLR
jgi:hypothetical protein